MRSRSAPTGWIGSIRTIIASDHASPSACPRRPGRGRGGGAHPPADGSTGWRRFRAAPDLQASGRFLEWLGLSFDIDGEKNRPDPARSGRPVTGAQLRAARGLLKISVQKLSELADISIAVIRRLEELDGVSRDGSECARRLREALERRGAVFIFPSDMKPTATLR